MKYVSEEELYEIAKEIESNKTHSCEIDESQISATYRRLKRISIGIENMDERTVFDLSKYSTTEKETFFVTIIDLLELDNKILKKYFEETTEDGKYPNIKLLSALKKKDANVCLDKLMRSLFEKDAETYENTIVSYGNSFVKNFQYSREQSEEFAEEIKLDIAFCRSTVDEYKLIYKKYMETYIAEISIANNNKVNIGLYNPLETIFKIDAYIDIFTYLFMQSIIYGIMNDSKKTMAEKRDTLQRIIYDAKNKELEFGVGTKQRILWAFAVYVLFLSRRNMIWAEMDIQELLERQMNDAEYPMTVPEEYYYNYSEISEVKTRKELRRLILEGREEKEERFNENLARTQMLIRNLNQYAGRFLSDQYLQHVKAVYREIIDDDLKYSITKGNSCTAKTIAKKIEDPDTPMYENLVSTVFIRTKISRGLMREKGIVELYDLMNEIQNCIYNDILGVFITYDEIQIARNLRKVYSKYNKLIISKL